MPETTPTPTKKETWASRYKAKYSPDSEEVDMESEDYYGNLNAMADENEKMSGDIKKFNDAASKNPAMMDMINDVNDGKSFLSSLVSRYGIDNIKAALDDPEKLEELSAKNDEFVQGKMAEDEDNAAREKNIEETFNVLSQFADEKGLTDEQAQDIINGITEIVGDAIQGKYPRELFEMAWKAKHYDNDVADAAEQGEIKGRNTAIEAKLERSEGQPDLPPDLGNGGGAMAQEEGKKRKGVLPFSGKEFEY